MTSVPQRHNINKLYFATCCSHNANQVAGFLLLLPINIPTLSLFDLLASSTCFMASVRLLIILRGNRMAAVFALRNEEERTGGPRERRGECFVWEMLVLSKDLLCLSLACPLFPFPWCWFMGLSVARTRTRTGGGGVLHHSEWTRCTARTWIWSQSQTLNKHKITCNNCNLTC